MAGVAAGCFFCRDFPPDFVAVAVWRIGLPLFPYVLLSAWLDDQALPRKRPPELPAVHPGHHPPLSALADKRCACFKQARVLSKALNRVRRQGDRFGAEFVDRATIGLFLVGVE